jgi:hypothetical protein
MKKKKEKNDRNHLIKINEERNKINNENYGSINNMTTKNLKKLNLFLDIELLLMK